LRCNRYAKGLEARFSGTWTPPGDRGKAQLLLVQQPISTRCWRRSKWRVRRRPVWSGKV